jgi:hypothetical protein
VDFPVDPLNLEGDDVGVFLLEGISEGVVAKMSCNEDRDGLIFRVANDRATDIPNGVPCQHVKGVANHMCSNLGVVWRLTKVFLFKLFVQLQLLCEFFGSVLN